MIIVSRSKYLTLYIFCTYSLSQMPSFIVKHVCYIINFKTYWNGMVCKFENVTDNGNLLPFQINSYSKTKHDKQLRLRRRAEYMYVYILDPKRNKMIFANTQIQPKDWAYKPQVKNKFFACIITKAWISKEGICGHLGCKEGGGGGGLCIYRMFHHFLN